MNRIGGGTIGPLQPLDGELSRGGSGFNHLPSPRDRTGAKGILQRIGKGVTIGIRTGSPGGGRIQAVVGSPTLENGADGDGDRRRGASG